jgi:phosphoglycolate phosphatase
MSTPGIIFDFDGTLADTLPDIADAVNVGLQAFGLPAVPTESVRGWIGEGLPILCRRAAGTADHVDAQEMADIVTAHYRRHRLDKAAPFDGIPELLDSLTARNVPMAILSNKPHEHTGPMVDALFGKWSFVAVEGYREEPLRKPDPRTTLDVIGQMNLTPDQVLFVGDSGTDIATAVNAGTIAVGVTWGYRDQHELIETGAKHIVDEPDEILQVLEECLAN